MSRMLLIDGSHWMNIRNLSQILHIAQHTPFLKREGQTSVCWIALARNLLMTIRTRFNIINTNHSRICIRNRICCDAEEIKTNLFTWIKYIQRKSIFLISCNIYQKHDLVVRSFQINANISNDFIWTRFDGFLQRFGCHVSKKHQFITNIHTLIWTITMIPF